MIPKVVIDQSEQNGMQYIYRKNTVQSVRPAESLFGYTVWAHMIPPFKPDHTLILGYGGGTTAELMRKIWGACKITGVDIEAHESYNEYRINIMDAKHFLWEETRDSFFKNIKLVQKNRYDYVCIDLWDGDKTCDFIYETEFVVRLREIATKLVCLNILAADVTKMRAYNNYGFQFDRFVPIEKNSVQWWSVV